MTNTTGTDDRHLELDEVVGYVRGHLRAEEHLRIEQHLAACERCTAEVGDLVRLADRHTRRAAWVRYGPGIASAAAAALIVAVWTGRPSQTDGAATRDQPLASAMPPGPLAPIGATPGPVTFRWAPAAKADRYRVVLFDSTGATVFEGESADTELSLPDSVALSRNALYLWRVEAELSWDRWASSALVRFRPEAQGP